MHFEDDRPQPSVRSPDCGDPGDSSESSDPATGEWGTREDDALLARLRVDAADGAVLDAGCGNGRPVLDGLAPDRPVVGVDAATGQVARAARVAPGRVVQGNMTALPLASDAVAAVTAFRSVIHVPTSEHETVYEEFARVLQPGGVCYVTVGTETRAEPSDAWLDGGEPMEWTVLGPDESTRLLEATGFDVYDAVGLRDSVDASRDRANGRLVDADHPDAETVVLLARLPG
ncbi:class I SAM-dependent methyltransferase [Halorubellus sp. JP-L1]|uniref:class I SAM-dependent methyltransferase n=1 Tax=Halorubellus sp. JP-L1 TaxID=2715753 RepID=UPI00140A2B70|nr:class I SAM-dependent methyltransferase [Halorubellus sp. JP-L1]